MSQGSSQQRVFRNKKSHDVISIQDKLADRTSPYERRVGTPFDGLIFFAIFCFSNLNERQKASSSTRCKDGSRNIRRIRAEFCTRLDWRLDHRGQMRKKSRQKLTSKDSSPVKRESHRSIHIFWRKWFPMTRRSLRRSRTSIFTRREASGDPLVTFHEIGGVADFSEADRDAMEAGADFWRMSGAFLYRQSSKWRPFAPIESQTSQTKQQNH